MLSWIRACVLSAAVCTVPAAAVAATPAELLEEADRLTQTDEGFPDTYTRAVALYEQAAALDPKNPLPPVRMARAFLALGDWSEKNKRSWYERGEQAAERAVALKDDSADAHFFLAANRGNVVNLMPFWKVSPGIIGDLEKHLQRALALDPRHGRALHMMGILLNETPGPLRLMLSGKKDQVESYLTRAVEAEGDRYAYIRSSVAEYYRDTGRPAQARAQAQALLAMSRPVDRRVWIEKYRPEAEALLKQLAAP